MEPSYVISNKQSNSWPTFFGRKENYIKERNTEREKEGKIIIHQDEEDGKVDRSTTSVEKFVSDSVLV